VKHFKHEQRGKRRLHSRPNAGEVKHDRWWLEKEMELVQPRLVLALAGKPLSISGHRGPRDFGGRPGFITIHPSFLLRMPRADRPKAWRRFVADMKKIRALSEGELHAA